VARGLLSTQTMSVYSTQYHAMVHSPASDMEQVTVSAGKSQDNGGQGEGFFHHLLDVINPLQHLPIVGTLYRAITGEHIGPVEKVMGDALYGGLWGAASSVADLAFEGVTGKSLEDTVLGWFKHDDGIRVASRKVTASDLPPSISLTSIDMPALPSEQPASAGPNSLDLAAFGNALTAKGINGEMAQRAMYAYRRSMGVPAQPVLNSIN
jgi:hypothetical protein